MTAIDRYRIETPPEYPLAPICSRHPNVESVFIEMPMRMLEAGEEIVLVRGWACRRCWTARGYRIEVAQ